VPIRRREFLKALAASGAALVNRGKTLDGAAGAPMSAEKSPGKTYDVAVIGAGVFGAWTAHELQRSGRSVLLLDAYGPSNSRASSGGESRIIRMGYGADEVYTRWSKRSLPRWQELFARAGQKLFYQTGMLWMANEGESQASSTLATLAKVGVQFEKLSGAELAKRYPQISFERNAWGILEPESGVLMARRAVQVVVEETLQNGAEYRAEAVETPAGRGRLESIRTRSGDSIRVGTFVFACGPWLPQVFPDVLGGRIVTSRQEVFFFGVPAGDQRFALPAMPTWINLADEMYGIPDLESRGFKIAIDRHGPPINPDTEKRVVSPENLATVRAYLAKRFPALGAAPVVETRVCQYENTSNGDFLVDRHPDFENVWLVGGGSGHGFKHGPAMGEYVAAQVSGSGVAEPRFSLATKEQSQKRAVY
jgi:monomeric sarcosine oxidase